jgi:branched-chain amino acid transport system permease protein
MSEIQTHAELENRRESAKTRLNGLPVTTPVLVGGVLAVGAIVFGTFRQSELKAWLLILLAIACPAIFALCSAFENVSRRGKQLRWVLIGGAILFLTLFPIGRANSTLIDLGLFVVFAIAVIGLNLTQGFAGQVTLAQAAFMGIGAYTSSLLNSGLPVEWGPLKGTLPNLPFLLTIPISAGVCFLLSTLIGFPALRVQGPWLSFVTIAFNALVVLVMNNQAGLTNGPQGVRALRTDMKIFGISMFETGNYYYFCLAVMLLAALAVWWTIRSPWGRSFKALRDNPGRASSLGVSVPTYTLLAFAIGSSLAGIAGALYAPLVEFIEPGSFTVTKSFSFLLAAVVGGVGTLVGPFIGTAFITFLENHLRFLGDNYQIAFAIFVIAMMIVSPKGIVGITTRIRASIVGRRNS